MNLTIYLPKRDFFLRVPHGDLYIHYFLYFCNSKHLEVNIDRGLLGPQPKLFKFYSHVFISSLTPSKSKD